MADYVDNLEYHLKFPPSIPKNLNSLDDKSDLICLGDQEKLPVVILFGWAGCQDKYLAKYSAIYEERGYITLRCTSPVVVTFLRHDKLPKLGSKFLDLLRELSLDEHPIFFHVFSNGGAFFYQHVSLQMEKRNKILPVKGVIFDSAPGRRRFYSVYKAIYNIMYGSRWYHSIASGLITIFLLLSFLLMGIIRIVFRYKYLHFDPFKLTNEPFYWPQLFIYSQDDVLVRCEDVECFAAIREKMGVKVERLRFDRSPHVQHLLTFRELYINSVMNFLQSCLGESNK